MSKRVILLLRKGSGQNEIRNWRFVCKDEHLESSIQDWQEMGWDVEVYDSIPFKQ